VSGSTAWPDWFARHAPRLETPNPKLAEAYASAWFAVFNDKPRDLGLQLRDARWMRAPYGVQERLDAWLAGGDPYSAAIEFAEHHQLNLYAVRDRALDYVFTRGGFDRLPPDEEEAVWHWGMVRSLGGPDLRDAFLRAHPRFESALPFLYDDFGPRERAALPPPRTPWEMAALERVAASTRDEALIRRFTPVSLDTFFRGVVVDGLVDAGPLRVHGVPFKDEEITLERDGPGGPARASESRRSSPPR
jgi:hypothetical protein